jgi:hypothetical protein
LGWSAAIPVAIVFIKEERNAQVLPTDLLQETRQTITCSASKLSWAKIKIF